MSKAAGVIKTQRLCGDGVVLLSRRPVEVRTNYCYDEVLGSQHCCECAEWRVCGVGPTFSAAFNDLVDELVKKNEQEHVGEVVRLNNWEELNEC